MNRYTPLSCEERSNLAVWDGQSPGHYEVWYLKLNIPDERLAFWLRYTITSSLPGIGEPVVELWGIAFDAANPSRNQGFKETFPASPEAIGRQGFRLLAGEAWIDQHGCAGSLGKSSPEGGLEWRLTFHPDGPGFQHFPHDWMYQRKLPKTKVKAPLLSMAMDGSVHCWGKTYNFKGMRGHQAHIWGSKHAEGWAWCNCNAFEDAPGAVFEALSARIALGPLISPDLTVLMLRTPEKEYSFNKMSLWLRNSSKYDLSHWHMEARQGLYRLEADISNTIQNMVGVTYRDPDGETRVCHNSKLADLEVKLYERCGRRWTEKQRFYSKEQAAFEVVERKADPQVPVLIP